MAKFTAFSCDECTAVRGPANHWLLLNTKHSRVEVMPWEDNAAQEENILHICGEGCATKVLSRQVSAWRVA